MWKALSRYPAAAADRSAGWTLNKLVCKDAGESEESLPSAFQKKKPLRISQAFLPTSVESCQHSHSTFKCQNLSNGLLQIFSPRLKWVHSFISLTHETMTLWIEPAPLFGIKSHEQKNLATLTTFKKLSKRKKMNGSLISIKGLQLVKVLSCEDKKIHSNRLLICTLTGYLLVNHVKLSHTFGRFLQLLLFRLLMSSIWTNEKHWGSNDAPMSTKIALPVIRYLNF